jgi:hypothetical protein
MDGKNAPKQNSGKVQKNTSMLLLQKIIRDLALLELPKKRIFEKMELQNDEISVYKYLLWP